VHRYKVRLIPIFLLFVGTSAKCIHHFRKHNTSSLGIPQSEFNTVTSKGYNLNAFAHFLIGPRSCLAKPLAYLELMLCTAHFVWGLEFEAVDSTGCFGKGMGRDRERERMSFKWWTCSVVISKDLCYDSGGGGGGGGGGKLEVPLEFADGDPDIMILLSREKSNG
jgi:hypothetical protein